MGISKNGERKLPQKVNFDIFFAFDTNLRRDFFNGFKV